MRLTFSSVVIFILTIYDLESLLYATVGVHPCHALDVENFPDPEQYMTEIEELAKDAKAAGTVKAFGEIG